MNDKNCSKCGTVMIPQSYIDPKSKSNIEILLCCNCGHTEELNDGGDINE